MTSRIIVFFGLTVLLILSACGKGDKPKEELAVPLTQMPAAKVKDTSAAANAAYRQVLDKCKNEDGAGLWAMTAPNFRASGNQFASQLVDLGSQTLKEVYQYDGPAESFNGEDYLKGALQMGDVPDNPCAHWENWFILEQQESNEVYTFIIGRPDGRGFSLKMAKIDKKWTISEITQAMVIPEHLLPDDMKKNQNDSPAKELTPKKPEPENQAVVPPKPPKSFGVKVCDEYAMLACSCSDSVRREFVCKEVHTMFVEFKKIASNSGMRSFVMQGCQNGIDSIQNVCR